MNAYFKRSDVRPVVSEFLTARSFYGAAIHIYRSGEGFAPALCGYDNLVYEGSAVDASQVIESVNRQHNGWFWCAKCASEISGLTVETILKGRN